MSLGGDKGRGVDENLDVTCMGECCFEVSGWGIVERLDGTWI